MDLLRLLRIGLAQIVQPHSGGQLEGVDQWTYIRYALQPELDESIIKVLPLIQPLQVASCDINCTGTDWRINKEPCTTRQTRRIQKVQLSNTYNSSGSVTGEGDVRAFRADCRVVLRSVLYILRHDEPSPMQLQGKHAHRVGGADADERSDTITVVESSFAGPAERGDCRLREVFDRV